MVLQCCSLYTYNSNTIFLCWSSIVVNCVRPVFRRTDHPHTPMAEVALLPSIHHNPDSDYDDNDGSDEDSYDCDNDYDVDDDDDDDDADDNDDDDDNHDDEDDLDKGGAHKALILGGRFL